MAKIDMSNYRQLYRTFLDNLDSLHRGNSVDGLEANVQKVFLGLSQGLKTEDHAELDKSNAVADNLARYCELRNHRRKIEIAGVKREMAPETEILESLQSVQGVVLDIVTPYFGRTNDFVSTMVHENANLSLGYVWSITQSAGEGYVPLSERYEAKIDAVDIARQGLNIQRGFDPNTQDAIKNLRSAFQKMATPMKKARIEFLRPFESSFTSPKNITHKNQDIELACDRVIQDGYKPEFLVPIAHGGVELGLIMDLRFREQGIEPITYPVLFSIKTRRHAKPLTKGDNPLFTSMPQGKVLITEDWITTGNTMRGVCNEIESYFPDDIRIATIKQDPRSLSVPLVSRYKIYSGVLSEYKGKKNDQVGPNLLF